MGFKIRDDELIIILNEALVDDRLFLGSRTLKVMGILDLVILLLYRGDTDGSGRRRLLLIVLKDWRRYWVFIVLVRTFLVCVEKPFAVVVVLVVIVSFRFKYWLFLASFLF